MGLHESFAGLKKEHVAFTFGFAQAHLAVDTPARKAEETAELTMQLRTMSPAAEAVARQIRDVTLAEGTDSRQAELMHRGAVAAGWATAKVMHCLNGDGILDLWEITPAEVLPITDHLLARCSFDEIGNSDGIREIAAHTDNHYPTLGHIPELLRDGEPSPDGIYLQWGGTLAMGTLAYVALEVPIPGMADAASAH